MRELGTVVVADASAVARQLFGLCFSRVARNVRPAPNAEAALEELATANAPALLVADARLPEIGALGLFAQCAGLAVRPALIVTTCHGDALEEERARDAGALGYLTKPVRFRELFQLLHERDAEAPRAAPRVHLGTLVYAVAIEPDARTPVARWDVYDISNTGALLLTHGSLPVGAELSLSLVIGDRALPVHARVVRVQPPTCVAVRFLDAPPQMDAALAELKARVALA